jgi:hypothetical protein
MSTPPERDGSDRRGDPAADGLAVHQRAERDDPDPQARLVSLERGRWRLDLRHHTGKWEQTPFTDSLDELLDTALGIGRLQDLR